MGNANDDKGKVIDVKKSFFFFVIVAAGILSLILSGCFQMQTTISFDSYIQATPFSSISHIRIFIKSINANNGSIGVPNLNQEYDLVSSFNVAHTFYIAGQITGLQNLAFSGNGPFSINSISMNIGPDATVVLGNGTQYVVPVATTITIPFYNYSNQSMQQAPLLITSGQNKTALILWNLSDLSTAAINPIVLNAMGLDMSQTVPLYITHGISSDPFLYDGLYRYASVSDFSKTFTFTAQGYWNTLNNTYDFTLYPFIAPTSQEYSAAVSINSATQTIAASNIKIGSSPSSSISLNI